MKDDASNSLNGFRENNPETYRMVAYPTLANTVFGDKTVEEVEQLTKNPTDRRTMYEKNNEKLISPYSEDFRQFVGPEYKENEFAVWMNAIGVNFKDTNQRKMKISEICEKNADNVTEFSNYLDNQ